MATDNYRDALARLQAHYASEVNVRRNDAVATIESVIDTLRTTRDMLQQGKSSQYGTCIDDLRTLMPRVMIRVDDLRRAEQALVPIKREIKALGMPEQD